MKLFFATTLALAAASASAVPLVGLTSSNELALFDSSDVTMSTTVGITGLSVGDRLVGIDLRGMDNKIYGISLSNNLYTIDHLSGAVSLVAALSAPVVNSSLGFGFDFNPVADAAGNVSLRFVTSGGNNYAVNANDGTVGNAASNIGNGFSAVAYTPANTSTSPATTSLYYINSDTDALSKATTGFNAPTVTPVGNLGVDVLKASGFEITADGTAFAALNVDGSSLTSGLYSINLTTGAATSLGIYNGTLSGLTVAPIPEPGTYAMLLAGLVAMGSLVKRRQSRG